MTWNNSAETQERLVAMVRYNEEDEHTGLGHGNDQHWASGKLIWP